MKVDVSNLTLSNALDGEIERQFQEELIKMNEIRDPETRGDYASKGDELEFEMTIKLKLKVDPKDNCVMIGSCNMKAPPRRMQKQNVFITGDGKYKVGSGTTVPDEPNQKVSKIG